MCRVPDLWVEIAEVVFPNPLMFANGTTPPGLFSLTLLKLERFHEI